MSLKNKTIIVTGGNGLIGKQIIYDIIKEGGVPISVDINILDDEDYIQEYCDITSEDSVKKIILKIIKKYKKIDGLVNNAYPRTADWGNLFEDIKFQSWRKNIDLQLNSVFILLQYVLNVMKKQNHGSIINMASIYGFKSPDFSIYNGTNMTTPAAYSAIKGGIINLTRYLSSYYGKYSININSISPGGVFNDQNKIFINNYIKKVPLGRMCKPEDISSLVVFLMSDKSSYITGENIVVDGGFTLN
tara:strand:+ start:614 stop:1351 length:738 start_codon:yes stop_codon:yes gene_type:complete